MTPTGTDWRTRQDGNKARRCRDLCGAIAFKYVSSASMIIAFCPLPVRVAASDNSCCSCLLIRKLDVTEGTTLV
jgi:hypothetical protein